MDTVDLHIKVSEEFATRLRVHCITNKLRLGRFVELSLNDKLTSRQSAPLQEQKAAPPLAPVAAEDESKEIWEKRNRSLAEAKERLATGKANLHKFGSSATHYVKDKDAQE